MDLNYWILPVAALVPMIVGFIWYHEKVFGTIWMNASGMTPEKMQSGNMAVIFGLAYFFSLLLATAILGMCIHQLGTFQTLVSDPNFGTDGSDAANLYHTFMENYGNNHRDFGHGVVHGIIAGVTFALPIIATNALFERKGWKYIAVNGGYWIVSAALMGGVIGHFA